MTSADLLSYVGASSEDAAFVSACWDQAVTLVDQFVAGANVPDDVLDRAYLETGSELFHRRSAPNGISQFAAFDGSAIRVARDPMVGAYPLLQGWVLNF